jgi:hypothetical protein
VTVEQVCRALVLACRKYLSRKRATTETDCLCDLLQYHPKAPLLELLFARAGSSDIVRPAIAIEASLPAALTRVARVFAT